MRKIDGISEDDLDRLHVTVSTDHPRSEFGLPLRVIMGGLSEQPAVPPPVPAVPTVPSDGTQTAVQRLTDELARANARISELQDRPMPVPIDLTPILARLQALEQAPALLHTAAQPPSDMPAFLQRAAAAAGVLAPEQHDTGVDRAVDLIHEIEHGVTDQLRRLAERLDAIERRLDIPTAPPVDAASTQAVQELGAYLKALDQRVTEADAHARAAEEAARQARAERAATPMPEQKRQPATLAEAKTEALDRIRAAGRARRDALIGGSADARDTLARLANAAIEARVGNRAVSLEQMEQLAGSTGEKWHEVAKRLIGDHDRATEVVAATLAIELRAETLLGPHLTQAAIEAEVAGIIEAINRVGE